MDARTGADLADPQRVTDLGRQVLRTARLTLERLTIEHAAGMTAVLADPALYAVTGVVPPSQADLRARYARQIAGPGRPGEAWLNWVLHERHAGQQRNPDLDQDHHHDHHPDPDHDHDHDHDRPVGFLQATVTSTSVGSAAAIAWLVGVPDQGRGLATEAAQALAEHLRRQGGCALTAWVADRNTASGRVAERLGLRRTARRVDGEQRWTDAPVRCAAATGG